MKYDELIQCPKTKGKFCYKIQTTPTITTYMSLNSGFWTNSLMKEGEEFYQQQFATLPELHKEIAWKDPETGLIWIPNLINEPGKGMIFADGTSKDNWGWASIKSIKIPIHEQRKHPHPTQKGKFLEYRMDTENIKHFHESDYIGALENLDLLSIDI